MTITIFDHWLNATRQSDPEVGNSFSVLWERYLAGDPISGFHVTVLYSGKCPDLRSILKPYPTALYTRQIKFYGWEDETSEDDDEFLDEDEFLCIIVDGVRGVVRIPGDGYYRLFDSAELANIFNSLPERSPWGYNPTIEKVAADHQQVIHPERSKELWLMDLDKWDYLDEDPSFLRSRIVKLITVGDEDPAAYNTAKHITMVLPSGSGNGNGMAGLLEDIFRHASGDPSFTIMISPGCSLEMQDTLSRYISNAGTQVYALKPSMKNYFCFIRDGEEGYVGSISGGIKYFKNPEIAKHLQDIFSRLGGPLPKTYSFEESRMLLRDTFGAPDDLEELTRFLGVLASEGKEGESKMVLLGMYDGPRSEVKSTEPDLGVEDTTVVGIDTEDAVPGWKELSPDEWIFETEFGCLRVDDGADYRFDEDENAAFLAYWDWEDTFEIGYFDTIDEAKEACMKDLERRIKPLAEALGLVWVAEPTEDEEPCFCEDEESDATYTNKLGNEDQGTGLDKQTAALSKADARVLGRLRPNDSVTLSDGRHIRCLDSSDPSICQYCALYLQCRYHNEKGTEVKCGVSRFFRVEAQMEVPEGAGSHCVQVKTPVLCPKCGGDGYIRLAGYGDDSRTCDRCEGTGKV